MSSVKTIIVDDETSSVLTLKGMLQKYCPDIEVIAEANGVESAVEVITRLQPALVFLDIELPPSGQGFDILAMIPNPSFGVIFTTAFSDYAIKAINDIQPWGYLIKPFRERDLITAVNTALAKIKQRATENQPFDRNKRALIVPDRKKGNVIIYFKDILYCKADNRITYIYFLQADKVVKMASAHSLKIIEQQLNTKNFFRTHHSYIVNMNHILRYQKMGRNGLIYLPQQCTVEISVTKMGSFESAFKQFLGEGSV